MWQWLQTRLKESLWGWLSALIVLVSAPFWSEFRVSIVRATLAGLSPTALMSLSFALFLLCLFLGALLFDAHKRERLFRKFEADPDFPGLLRHKKRHDEKVCPDCLADGFYVRVYPIGDDCFCSRTGCDFMSKRSRA